MSEYCYQCTGCGNFKGECKCPKGFQDPMEPWKSMSDLELRMELQNEFE